VKLVKGAGPPRPFDLAPARLKPGEYACRVAVSKAGGAPVAYRELQVTVAPALRRDHFLASTWGAGLSGPELAYSTRWGSIRFDCGNTDPGTVEALGGAGLPCSTGTSTTTAAGISARPRDQRLGRGPRPSPGPLAPLPNWRGDADQLRDRAGLGPPQRGAADGVV